MATPQLHPQFLTNSEGEKTSVLLPIDEFYELLEDLEDLSVVAQRRDEPTFSMKEVRKELGLENRV